MDILLVFVLSCFYALMLLSKAFVSSNLILRLKKISMTSSISNCFHIIVLPFTVTPYFHDVLEKVVWMGIPFAYLKFFDSCLLGSFLLYLSMKSLSSM